MTRLMSVLLPDPLDPTRAVVEPAGARNEMLVSTGVPGLYSKPTCWNSTSPRSTGRAARSASSWSSVAIWRISRMRSKPANASVSCVPMLASCTTGTVMRAVKVRYMTKSPIVICPWRMALPPTNIIEMPIAPSTNVENADTVETPVNDCATLRNKRCAPLANTSSSRFSAV